MRKQLGFPIPITVTLMCAAGLAAVYLLGAVRGQAETPKAKPAAAFVGTETCVMCHEEVLTQVKKSPHGLAMTAVEEKKKGHVCEGCHGPGSLHAEDPSKETAQPLLHTAQSGEGCFQCHDKKLSRANWLSTRHAKMEGSCMACHGRARDAATPPEAPVKDRVAEAPKDASEAKQPKKSTEPEPFDHAAFTRVPSSQACLSCHNEQRAEFSLPSHHPVKEGRIECADCHDPHRPVTEKIKLETCTKCHLGQRGPHIYEHGAISGNGLTDACLSCHVPHGSPNQRMLKLTNRGLCLQCHADRATHFPGRNCADCHQAVHGSNTSTLLFRE